MSEASPQPSDEKPAKNASESDRSILNFAGRALITVIVTAILTTLATRQEYLCPVCQGTKDVVA